jgi:hypothetical protein
MTAAPQKEVTFHIQLVAMLRWCLRPDVIMRHVPNGEHRDPRTAAKLKAMGVLPGSADLEFHWAEWENNRIGNVRRLLHLELKVAKRPPSHAQVVFAMRVRELGDAYHIARSIDEAIGIIGRYGLIRPDVEVCGKRWVGNSPQPNFDPVADFAGSLDEAYRAIRKRQAAGGPGWTPKEPK